MRIHDRISRVQDIMTSMHMPCWLMYCDEGSDPFFQQIVTNRTSSPAIAIVTPTDCRVYVSQLDADNVRGHNGMDVSAVTDKRDLWAKVSDGIRTVGYPQTIALTYSSLGDAQVDVLGYGLYRELSKQLRRLYRVDGHAISFCSADTLLYAYFDRKSRAEIAKMRLAARRALDIVEEAFAKLTCGMTEIDAVQLVHRIMRKQPAYLHEAGVVSEETAWEPSGCPVVLAGPSLAKGGHAMATRQRIGRGHTVYFDFGVTLSFADGSKWSSDIQRMGYVLAANEQEPPLPVQTMFRVLSQAVTKGTKFIRPGMKGYEVDEVVRRGITAAGFPDYNHATGHAIGELAHNPGALLAPRNREMARLTIQSNGVYTIEPRIAIENGGSIEEMVLVTDSGGIPLCRPQKSLYLIK